MLVSSSYYYYRLGALTHWTFKCKKRDNYEKSFFDKVIYINLDRRPDRKKNIENQLKPYIKNYERFPAQDGKKLNLQFQSPDFITKKGINDILSKINNLEYPLQKEQLDVHCHTKNCGKWSLKVIIIKF